MRSRWMVVIVIASLCLNLAVVGTYFFRRARRDRPHRFPARRLAAEVRERLRQAREAAMPEFAAEADKVESTDSLLWVEMGRESPDSVRVESLCQELGRIHGTMRAMVFRQMHRELAMLPDGDRAEYLTHMKTMKPGPGRPGRGMGRHARRGLRVPVPGEGEPPTRPQPESGD